MRNPGLEAGLPYQLLALIVLAAFYAAYFGKLLAQRRRGIQTDQIGRRKERTLHRVEVLMKAATCAIVPAQLLSIGLNWSAMPAGARLTGFFVGLAGDGLFLAAALCMRDSWRAGIPEKDRTELVTSGIYAFSRNPAFLGFDLMYIGLLLMFFNPLVCLMTAFAVVMLHLQILQEENYMAATFGEAYLCYKRRVLRYLGRRKDKK